ncbi:hypothetical protein JIN85_20125 [Luteolibacter pohnpeiensis]|uniref:Uncharacterized protein n=1 Tax=Luteolibacter pohnpeiensis TaxID=454153 RepID=A0A934SB30_9BACT|nr:hypothetical protein [Luteolibacter pohnpeiensis]MBK1884730.1 hypothetical protein [Luteolibacter pohnpeiensis]
MSYTKRPYWRWGIIPNLRKKYEVDQNRQLQIFHKGDIQTVQLEGMTTSIVRGKGLRGLLRRIFGLGDLRVKGSPGDYELPNVWNAMEFKSALDGRHSAVIPPGLPGSKLQKSPIRRGSTILTIPAVNCSGFVWRQIHHLVFTEYGVGVRSFGVIYSWIPYEHIEQWQHLYLTDDKEDGIYLYADKSKKEPNWFSDDYGPGFFWLDPTSLEPISRIFKDKGVSRKANWVGTKEEL